MLESITSVQLSEWMAYAAIEPFGEERADLRNAMLMSLIANVNRDEKKRSDPFTPAEFMPKFWQSVFGASSGVTVEPAKSSEPARLTSDQLLAKVAFMNQLLGGVDNRKNV